jgi:catechol 2,3-dioxygenase-like lactoylglutathione lyase family enzyme
MFVETMTVTPAVGRDDRLAAELRDIATRLFQAPGCYAAYVLAMEGSSTLTCQSFWVGRDDLRRAFPDGTPSPDPAGCLGPPERRSFTALEGPGRDAPLLTHLALRVTDLDRSVRFYTGLLDLEPVTPVREIPGIGARIVVLHHPRTHQQLELNCYPPGGQFGTPFVPGEAFDHFGVRVANVDRFLERARTYGCDPLDLRPYREYPVHRQENGFRVAYVADPDGNTIAAYEIPWMSIDAPFGGEY